LFFHILDFEIKNFSPNFTFLWKSLRKKIH
jgi:hypothetical protein